jgi:hypothetical protein
MTCRLATGKVNARPRGFILAYLMFALAIAGVVTVGLAQIRSRDVQAEVLTANVDRIVAAVTVIRGQLILCAATYPVGAVVPVVANDGTVIGTVTTEFPVLAGPNPGDLRARVNGLASDMNCPGRPAGTSRNVWAGNDGVFFPPGAPGFGPWSYSVHTDTGGASLRVTRIEISLSSTSGEAGRAVLRRVRLRLLERGGNLGSTVQLTNNDDTLTVVLLDTTTP